MQRRSVGGYKIASMVGTQLEENQGRRSFPTKNFLKKFVLFLKVSLSKKLTCFLVFRLLFLFSLFSSAKFLSQVFIKIHGFQFFEVLKGHMTVDDAHLKKRRNIFSSPGLQVVMVSQAVPSPIVQINYVKNLPVFLVVRGLLFGRPCLDFLIVSFKLLLWGFFDLFDHQDNLFFWFPARPKAHFLGSLLKVWCL